MNEKELQERFAPVKYETQEEFQRKMTELGEEWQKVKSPNWDRIWQINMEIMAANTQINDIMNEIHRLKTEKYMLSQTNSHLDRFFGSLRNSLILSNPQYNGINEK
jgi:uncharacterized protein (DUF3084 family)